MKATQRHDAGVNRSVAHTLAFQLAEQRPAYAVFPEWMWSSMQGAGHLDGLERKVLWEHASNILVRLRERRE